MCSNFLMNLGTDRRTQVSLLPEAGLGPEEGSLTGVGGEVGRMRWVWLLFWVGLYL